MLIANRGNTAYMRSKSRASRKKNKIDRKPTCLRDVQHGMDIAGLTDFRYSGRVAAFAVRRDVAPRKNMNLRTTMMEFDDPMACRILGLYAVFTHIGTTEFCKEMVLPLHLM